MIALDTNILIYATGNDACSEAARSIVIRAAIGGSIIPAQVFAEFLNVCRRKNLLRSNAALDRIEEWAAVFTVPTTTLPALRGAADLAERRQLSFFDALIARVAHEAGATILLSEDMRDGIDLDGLIIINPFSPANQDKLNALLPPC